MSNSSDNLIQANDIIHSTMRRFLVDNSEYKITKSKREIYDIVTNENNNFPVADNTLKILINYFGIQGVDFNGGW